MSNFRSIAVVTATLERLLQSAANQAVQQADVRVGPPSAKLGEDGKAVINLCLFRVLPSPASRNDFLPLRDGAGTPRQAARLALDLHYVVSFYGDASRFEPERLMGAAALALEHSPGLSQTAIESAIADPLNQTALSGSDLPDTGPAIRIEPESHTLEDLSKLWSVFYQVPYALSAFYVARRVEIETQDDPGSAVPVMRPDIYVAPSRRLRIRLAGPAIGISGPVEWGGMLHIAGSGIARIGNSLKVNDAVIALGDDAFAGQQIVLPVDDALFAGGAAKAGNHVISILAPLASDQQPAHLREQSNAVGITIRPIITLGANPANISSGNAALRSGTVAVSIEPPLQEGQSARLFLNAAGSPASAAITAEAPAAFPADTLTFAFAGLPRDSYLLRVEVDEVSSLVETGNDPQQPEYGQIIGPMVDLS
jgi:hypothetical protein